MVHPDVKRDKCNILWDVGDVVFGVYRVGRVAESAERHYAEGGMGRVYRLYHMGWGIDLAAKVPLGEAISDLGGGQAFIDECQTWVNLAPHPHVVPCYYVRAVERMPVVFAEFVEGGTLSHWIRSGKAYQGGHRHALGRLLDIAIQTAWGLHHSHQQGLVHQDMKPANVMMTPDGTAMITDFGLARARAAGGVGGLSPGAGHSLMVPGAGFMTREYASPEQIDGMPLNRRTDMWSWAVSVLEMFVGELTWRSGEAAPEVLKHCRETGAEAPEIPRLPKPVGELLARCLQRSLEERFPDMAVIAATMREMFPRLVGEEHERPIPKLVEIRASGLNNKALSLLDLGDDQTARRLLNQAIRANPMHPEATYNLGLLDWRAGNLTDDALIAKLRAVQSSQPYDWQPRFLTSLVHLERGDKESAVEILATPSGQGLSDHEVQNALERAVRLSPGQGPCVRVLRDHEGQLTGLAASEDGRSLLSSAWDQTVRLWRLSDCRCERILAGHQAPVVGVAVSRDGRFAISASRGGELRLWETATGQCVLTLDTQQREVWNIAASSDCASVCVATGDNNIWLHDMHTGRCVGSFSGHSGLVSDMQVSPNGDFLVTASWDGTLVVWDFLTRKARKLTDLYAGKLNAVAISPDGHTALVGCEDMRIWHVDLVSGTKLGALVGHGARVDSVAFSAHGRSAASGSADKTVRLWDVASGRCLRTFEGHERSVTAVVFSPDGCRVYSGGSDNTIRVWELSDGQPSHFAVCRPQPVVAQTAAGNEHRAKLVQARRAMELGEIAHTLRLVAKARNLPEFAHSRKALDLLAAAGRFGRRTRLDLVLPGVLSRQQASEVTCVAIESNDRHAAIRCRCGIGSRAELWRVPGFQVEQRMAMAGFKNGDVLLLTMGQRQSSALENQQAPVWSVGFLPGGQRCQVWPRLKKPRIYDVPNGRRVLEDNPPTDSGEDLTQGILGAKPKAASSNHPIGSSESWDGGWRLSCEDHDSLVLSDQRTKQEVRLAEGDNFRALCAAITPDGRHGFSGGPDGVVRIWDLAECRCIHRLEVNCAAVTCIACSTDARWILAGAKDGSVRMWELVWEYEFPGWAEWIAEAQPQTSAFVARSGIINWSDWTDELKCRWLLDLQCIGYGWIKPDAALRAAQEGLP